MDNHEKHAYLEAIRKRYRKAKRADKGKVPNCLIKNLSETHSLPHVRNLSEISRSEYLNGRQSEVNDERQESGNQGVVKPIQEGPQEGEGADSGRAGCIDGVQPLVCGRVVAMGWQSDPRRATGASGRRFAQEGKTHKTSAVRRSGAGKPEGDMGNHGLHLRQTAGGDPAGGYPGTGEAP